MSDITATSVKLTWSYKGSDEVQYYVIQHKPKHVNQAFAEISGITTMYYHVRSLSPYTEYELYVIAVNTIGRGPPSAPVTVTTGETSQYTFPFAVSSFAYFSLSLVSQHQRLRLIAPRKIHALLDGADCTEYSALRGPLPRRDRREKHRRYRIVSRFVRQGIRSSRRFPNSRQAKEDGRDRSLRTAPRIERITVSSIARISIACTLRHVRIHRAAACTR